MRPRHLLGLVILSLATALPARAADVAILLSASVDAYDDALRGFKEEFGHRIVAEYDMEGDFDRGRRLLAEIEEEQPDLILAVGVWALQVIVAESPSIPVIYAMVLNPPSVVSAPSAEITGASMNVPLERAIEVFRGLGPEIRRVGVLYDPAHTGYLLGDARALAERSGLELVATPVRSAGAAVSALDSLQAQGIDALWILPDETVLAPAVVRHMLLSSYRSRIPLLGLSERHAEMGALAALYFASSEDIGRQAAELANRVLEGEAPRELPYTTARQVHLAVNLKTAKKLGLEIPPSFVGSAQELIR